MFWTVFAQSAWAQPAIGVGRTTGDGASLVCVRLVGVAQTATLLAGTIGALHWPLIAMSVWAQPATVVGDTTGEGAALASGSSVDVGCARPGGRGPGK